jgi:hypothetical protein
VLRLAVTSKTRSCVSARRPLDAGIISTGSFVHRVLCFPALHSDRSNYWVILERRAGRNRPGSPWQDRRVSHNCTQFLHQFPLHDVGTMPAWAPASRQTPSRRVEDAQGASVPSLIALSGVNRHPIGKW